MTRPPRMTRVSVAPMIPRPVAVWIGCQDAGSTASVRQATVMSAIRCCFAQGPRNTCPHPKAGANRSHVGDKHCGDPSREAQQGTASDGQPRPAEDQYISDSIWDFVVELTNGRRLAAFDGYHAIEKVGEQSELDEPGAGEPTECVS